MCSLCFDFGDSLTSLTNIVEETFCDYHVAKDSTRADKKLLVKYLTGSLKQECFSYFDNKFGHQTLQKHN